MSAAGVRLRGANIADVGAIVALERSIETAPHWAPAAYAAVVDSKAEPQAGVQSVTAAHPAAPKRCLFVAETLSRGEIVGFAVGRMHPAEGVAELESVAVAKSVRREGIGRALCAAVLEWCRRNGAASVMLEVRSGSTGAVALYFGLGFAQAGRRPRYYRDPEDDALLLRLALMPSKSEQE
jgi:ribosomal-protein-alanine N-acetyltransferase